MATRLDETVTRVTAQARAGNVYVNRNLIDAVVGVQPFGGHGLSGTGPKAGGPLYLRRLLARRPRDTGLASSHVPVSARPWAEWLAQAGQAGAAARFAVDMTNTPVGAEQDLVGPVGERNLYGTEARGIVLCVAADRDELLRQVGAAVATGNRALVAGGALKGLPSLPASLSQWVQETSDWRRDDVSAILFSGSSEDLLALGQAAAERTEPIVLIHTSQPGGHYPLEWLVLERSVSTNTTAAGGNANLKQTV